MAAPPLSTKDVLKRLANKEFATPEERDALLAQLQAAQGLRAKDVIWMLYRPDRALRDAGAKLLAAYRDPETLDAFLLEGKGKPDAAVRAAAAGLFAVPLPGIERRFAEFLAPVAKPTNDTRAIQDLVRRTLAEAPQKKEYEPLLWQLEPTTLPDQRMALLEKLARFEPQAQMLSRWQRLASDEMESVRDLAVRVLATRAPAESLQVLAKQLPLVSYATQQVIVEALTKLPQEHGTAILDALLPLLASGDAGIRTAIVKVLVRLGNRATVIRRYIDFSMTLAGFVRERTLEALRDFGNELVEPTITLLGDENADVRASALGIAAMFEDARLVPPMIQLLKDPDWWVRIGAADALGRIKDPRSVEPLMAALADADVRWAAAEALGRIGDPRSLPALGKLLGDPLADIRVEAMQALKNFKHPQVIEALSSVATKDPDRTVRSRDVDLVAEISQRDRTNTDIAALRSTALAARSGQGEPRIHQLLVATRNQGASDFHLAIGQPPVVRLAADLLRAQGNSWTADDTHDMIREVLTDPQWDLLHKEQQLDFCYTIPNAGRYRANVFRDHRGLSAVFRVIPEEPPTIADLGLPPHLAEIADYHQGLILICGPSGSGKSTTLAALVNLLNETREHHIITMEDPVEFIHTFKHCLINQHEIGAHTESYARALRAALREDPDVIVIGELRDNESVELALTAAETGHVVLATISSTNAPKAIDRVISSFSVDDQPQIRSSLSESLRYVVAQKLLPARAGRRRVAAFEVLKGTSTVGAMIRDEKTYQIYSAMQIGRSQGMQTFDEALKDLLRRELIAPETAYLAAQKKEDFEPFVPAEFLGTLDG